jgi:hypothetical protein
MLASSSAGRAASKITPEIGSALHEILILADEFIDVQRQTSILP